MRRLLLLLLILCCSTQVSAQDQVIIPITGQQTMSGSTPVVIASDQSAVPVSQSGAWTNACTQSGTWTTASERAEDSLHNSGDVGIMSLGVVQRAGTVVSTTTTQSEYGFLSIGKEGQLFADINMELIGSEYQNQSILKAEDASHNSTSSGVMALGVRGPTNTPAARTTATDDYGAFDINQYGNIRPDIDYNFQSVPSRGLLKQEDDAHTSVDAGVMTLGVTNENQNTLVTAATGDYSALATNSRGGLYVEVKRTNQTSDTGSLLKAEDAGHVTGDAGVATFAIQRATPANQSDLDGDYEPLQISAGRLWASSKIDTALPAGTNNIGDVDVLTMPNVTIGTFPDNEPINVAQMNGVAVSMGSGTNGTGVQRVTIATDDEINDDIDAIRISAAAIDTDATTIIGHVDGIETLIGTTNTTLGAIDTDTGNIDTSLNNIESATGIPTTVSDTSQNVTTAGTRVQLSSATCKKIVITAKAANTGTIWVGGSTVASGRGIPLVALQNVMLDISNANAIYIDSTQNGEGVTYALLN